MCLNAANASSREGFASVDGFEDVCFVMDDPKHEQYWGISPGTKTHLIAMDLMSIRRIFESKFDANACR